MIAAQTTHVLASTVEGNSTEMSVDVESLDKLMGIMSNLYSNRPLAVIRELSTNALDAHLEIGKTDPIRITLPTPIDPYLRIQDFGLGLDAEDIREVYSKYGKSTRASTNNAVGMMGLGSKAPLTYTDAYTIVGIKGGVKYTTMVAKNERGVGVLSVVSEEPTTDPSGVLIEIMIGRDDVTRFRDEAAKFFRFWEPGTVLVDGEKPAQIEGTKVGDNMLIVRDNTDYVVMGNVPYPVKRSLYGSDETAINHDLNRGWALVVRVPIGAVSIPPAREDLMDDSHTKATLRKIEDDLKAAIAKSIQRDINACNSPFGAVRAMTKWQSILPKASRPSFGNYTFQGRTIPDSIEMPMGTISAPHSTSVLSRSSEFDKLHAEKFDKVIIFTGWTYAGFTPTMRRKLDKWVDENDMSDGRYEYVMTPAATFKSHWFDSAMVFPWEDVKSIKLTQAEAGAGGRGRYRSYRIPGSFDVYRDGDLHTGYPAQDIDTDEDVFYFNGNKNQAWHYRSITTDFFPDSTLVCVPDNRLNKFKRDFTTARSVTSVLREQADIFVKSIDPADVLTAALRSHSRTVSLYDSLNIDRVEDPEVKKYANLIKRDVSDYTRKLNTLQGLVYGAVKVPQVEIPEEPIRKNYRLLFDGSYYGNPNMDNHAYSYMNLMYEARKAGIDVD